MLRTWLLASAGAVALGTGLSAFLFTSSSVSARAEGKDKAEAAEAVTAQLPLGEVKLYSSGVGYFQREGTVEGNARVDLAFPVSDINDLIKSMVLRDLDRGHI